MKTVPISAVTAMPHAEARLVDAAALEQDLTRVLEGEVRFDKVSRALYSTDASVYQIEPLGVAVPKSREDLIRIVQICARHRCPLTLRGGGTSQAGQSIGEGLQVDCSKYYNRILEFNAEQRWVRVQPGIVLDELNAFLKPHGLRFAPDISTASRATIGGMIANNSSGARSVLYGKTIDHVLELELLLSDGSVVRAGPVDAQQLHHKLAGDSLEAQCYRTVRTVADACAAEVEARFPKVLRRVGGYNLDEFIRPDTPFNLAKMIVGSEGTLGVVLEARLNLVPLPKAKAVLAIQFSDTLEALAATPVILQHRPSAVEVMDKFILDHTRQSITLERIRQSFIQGDPGALLCVEFYDDAQANLPPRMDAVVADLRARQLGYRFHMATDLNEQARVWSLREAALGLSMAMKEEAKSISFVEDTAVAPERLRDYIDRFLGIIRRHETTAGIYAHASVGCLHVRPVVNLKTEDGVRKFEAIANEVADLVLEFGGALSGEHGDGLVRSPFLRKMFGPVLYDAFRTIKRAFDPDNILNPGKIVDPPPLTSNLRFGPGYRTPNPATWFDYSEYGGMAGAVEMCSGLGACRKKLDGTMCPSYMATLEEAHSTRGRANVLRLAMAGRLGEAGLGDEGVYEVLDLCLECRACKAECPVGVDVARFKSEFLADYWSRHGAAPHARMLGSAHEIAAWGSRFAPLANLVTSSRRMRAVNERVFGIDARRSLPRWSRQSFSQMATGRSSSTPDVVLFGDTFTNYYNPEIGVAALDVIEAAGLRASIAAGLCCGRPLISKGLLERARKRARAMTQALLRHAEAGRKIVFLEPSCLSAVREDAPSLLRGEEQREARTVAEASVAFEEFLTAQSGLSFAAGPSKVLLHAHCHQKSMGLLPVIKRLLARIPGATVIDPDAGCCGMAGSFGYEATHYEVSRQVGERRLFPAVRTLGKDGTIVAPGFSCRHQIYDFTEMKAVHPAMLLQSCLRR
jgi:FAD/FMN-containing dehydrogenase/Fe-S oxidoreductase